MSEEHFTESQEDSEEFTCVSKNLRGVSGDHIRSHKFQVASGRFKRPSGDFRGDSRKIQ